jgi:hypothetical protein
MIGMNKLIKVKKENPLDIKNILKHEIFYILVTLS